LRGTGTDAADFLRLRLRTDQRESVGKMVLAWIDRFLHPAALPPVINAAVGKYHKALVTLSDWKRQRNATAARK
jgi:hypothetical protein